MKDIIKIEIECGEKTCASKPGEFCHLLMASLNNKNSCYVFGPLIEKDGWVLRHKDCLKHCD